VPRAQSTQSMDDRQPVRLPHNLPEGAAGAKQEEEKTEQADKQKKAATTDGLPPSSANETSQASLGRSTADGSSATNKAITIVSFTKKNSTDNAAAAAEPGVSTSRKLHLSLPMPPQGQRQWPTQPPPSVAGSPPTSPGAASGTGRLSWSVEAGRNWAAQDVRSSAFLVIVLISLVSWAPFFLSISFPSALGLDMPHFRFLFFLNHVTNVFVYLALSPHIRAQLKVSLLYPMRQCQARRG